MSCTIVLNLLVSYVLLVASDSKDFTVVVVALKISQYCILYPIASSQKIDQGNEYYTIYHAINAYTLLYSY